MSILNRPLLLLGLALALLAGMGRQTAAAPASEYQIQPDDVLAIKVSGEPGLSKDYTVDGQGEITMDLIGKQKLTGMTLAQAKEHLTRELKGFLKVFEVSILITGELGNKVTVYGEVAKPGQVKVKNGARILDALAEAGKPTENADMRRAMLIRKDGTREPVDLEAALKDPKLNLELTPGDTITIPSKVTRAVYVDGEVTTPGAKPLETAATAYAAIRAAGPTERTDWTRVILRRRESSLPLTVDLSGVRTGVIKDDLTLQEGDRITVLSRFAGTASVQDEVKTPGEKDLIGPTQLLDFIATVGGGFTERADLGRVQVNRAGKGVQTVNLRLVQSGVRRPDDPELQVQPGDRIFVPSGLAVLRGEVKEPGEKNLGTNSNVMDFIQAQGKGFTNFASLGKVEIQRDGKQIMVDLRPVIEGKRRADDEEFRVLSGDIVTVPREERIFVIVGGVKNPGSYPWVPGMNIIDAVAAAGNFTERVDRKFVIARGGSLGLKQIPAPGAKKGDALVEMASADPSAATAKTERKDKKKNDKGKGEDEIPNEVQGTTLIQVDYKKLVNRDPKQLVGIEPGDRILIPEIPVQGPGRKPTLFDRLLGLGHLAGAMLFY